MKSFLSFLRSKPITNAYSMTKSRLGITHIWAQPSSTNAETNPPITTKTTSQSVFTWLRVGLTRWGPVYVNGWVELWAALIQVDDRLNWEGSCTLSPVKGEVPALAACHLTLEPEGATEQDTQGTVRTQLGECAVLWWKTREGGWTKWHREDSVLLL